MSVATDSRATTLLAENGRWVLPRDERRLTEIDSLRCLAALAVLWMHWTFYFGARYARPGVVPFRFPYGGFGVNLFFVISGFVITMTLERSKRTVDFIRARFFRLYPTFWICMLMSAILTAWLGPPERAVGLIDVLGNLSMVPGWLGLRAVDGVFWTLAVELVFYAWMAVFYALGALSNAKSRARLSLVWVALSVILKLGSRVFPHSVVTAPAFDVAMDGTLMPWIGLFGAGIVLFDSWRAGGKIPPEGWLLLPVALTNQLLWQSKTATAVMLFSVVAVWIAANLRPWVMRFAPVVWMGRVSYPLYLLHMNLGFIALWHAQAHHISFWYVYPVTFAAVLAISGIVHVAVEEPTSRLFKRKKAVG